MSQDSGYLLVRAGGRLVGLPVAQIVEVVDAGRTYPVPAVEPAFRGVVKVRGQILPVVNLGAFLAGGACPATAGETGVVLTLDGRRICLEVEKAELVWREPGLPVPAGATLPWAVAVARYAGELVPLLDLDALAPALAARFSEEQSA